MTVRDWAAWWDRKGLDAGMIVFEGSVENQELIDEQPSRYSPNIMSWPHRVVFIRVLRVYRGQAVGTVTVLTGRGGGDCGYDFETGRQYLVYADRKGPQDMVTSICTGTDRLEYAGPALRYLRGEAPTPDDLLDQQAHFEKFAPQWTASACGRVTKPDGSPLAQPSVHLAQLRDEPFIFPWSGPDIAKPDGTFCVHRMFPGKYLLTAEDKDYSAGFRWMGYYPGVAKRSEAVPVEIRGGDNLSNLQFTVSKQPLYTVSVRIVSTDGTPLPLEILGVSILSSDRDALASRHITVNRNEADKYILADVAPGHYSARTFQPGFTSGKVRVYPKWRMAEQDVEIQSDSEIVLKLDHPVD
jgi:hypothetical protein